MNLRELAWAAGLFEGEGSLTLHNKGKQPRASMSQVDESMVRRFHAAVGVGTVRGPYGPYQANKQAHYQWSCHTYADVQHVAAILWYGLSDRRRARVTEILEVTR